jgi:hypothetical protein
MTPHISLTSVLAAITLFAVTVAMHEAARADGGLGRDAFGQSICSSCAAAPGGTRLRANFLSIPHSANVGLYQFNAQTPPQVKKRTIQR